MEFDESIYNLIPKERYQPPKEKRHKSKHHPDIPPTSTTFALRTTTKPGVGNVSGALQPQGGSHTNVGDALTFGKPKGTLKPETTSFRKKGTGTMVLP